MFYAVRGEVPNCIDLFDPLKNVQPDCQILPAIKKPVVQSMNTNFGMVAKGSILSYQQKLSTDYITNMYIDQFPKLPICNLMQSDYNFA